MPGCGKGSLGIGQLCVVKSGFVGYPETDALGLCVKGCKDLPFALYLCGRTFASRISYAEQFFDFPFGAPSSPLRLGLGGSRGLKLAHTRDRSEDPPLRLDEAETGARGEAVALKIFVGYAPHRSSG